MSPSPKTAASFGIGHIELEVRIRAQPQRVWKALVDETSRWWHKDFYTSQEAKGFVIEAKLGGRMYEDWGNGAGQIWYTVTGVEPPRSLSLLGHLTPAFGGPAISMLQLNLKDEGGRTVLHLADTIAGKVNEDKPEFIREGWKTLFEDCLKTYVEGA
jgi:uncharacterized protein YndB with AHSA1/START domain